MRKTHTNIRFTFKLLFALCLLFTAHDGANARRQQTLGGLTKDDDNGYIPHEPCKGAPLAGASSVHVVVRENTQVLLVGERGGRIVWRRPFPLRGEVNRPKTYPSCEGRKIELHSQYPFSASTTIQTFNWNGRSLTYVSTRSEDASQEFFDEAVDAAVAGNAQALKKLFDEGADTGPDMLYPSNYVNGPSIGAAVKRAHATAVKLARAGREREAAERLALMFDTTLKLGETVAAEPSAKTSPGNWLEVWKALDVETADFIPALNDYGYFLQRTGDDRRAAQVFRAVIERDAKRAAAYLNLADSLWTLDEKDAAREQYRAYGRLMAAEKRPAKIPPRVAVRSR